MLFVIIRDQYALAVSNGFGNDKKVTIVVVYIVRTCGYVASFGSRQSGPNLTLAAKGDYALLVDQASLTKMVVHTLGFILFL